MPLSTGGLEQLARPIKDALHRRRFALKNRERLNRLLLLMQLHLNGLDDQTAYTTGIRDWLIANDGRPLGKPARDRRPAQRSLTALQQRRSGPRYPNGKREGGRA